MKVYQRDHNVYAKVDKNIDISVTFKSIMSANNNRELIKRRTFIHLEIVPISPFCV